MDALFKDGLLLPSEEVWISGGLSNRGADDLDIRGRIHLE